MKFNYPLIYGDHLQNNFYFDKVNI